MTSTKAASAAGTLLTGVFAGPVSGLTYETPTTSGITNERGEFHYLDGETVAFKVGRWVLGAAVGASRLNLADLANRVAGQLDKLHDASVTNAARLLQTLDQDGDLENGLTITPAAHDLFTFGTLNFDQMFSKVPAEEAFGADPMIAGLLEQLNAKDGVFTAKTPRALRSAAAARNELRRNIRGILKMTDVKIPVRDGSFVYADIFRPADDEKHPAIMNLGEYGKSFDHGSIGSEEDAEAKEQAEDRFFSGNPDSLQYENHETVNTSDWVPNGYVVIRIDARGVGNTPGVQAPLGRQEAEDYYDAIEWAAAQPWSNGKVGLWGMSYYAMSQHNVASLQPPHLAAMIAQGTDSDSYNEYLYGGGLFSEGFWNWWLKILTHGNSVGERRMVDWMGEALAHPFNDPAVYGPHAVTFMTPEVDKITTPVWIVGPQSGVVLHQLGSTETYVRSTSVAARKFDFVDAWFPRSYAPSTVAEHMRFFDYWLKDIDNGIMDEPPVRVQVRTGNAAVYTLNEQEWPIARTEYVKYYLDAQHSDWTGDEHGRRMFRLAPTAPSDERSTTWDAFLDLGMAVPAPLGRVGGTPRWATGISFISDPMSEDMTLVGYMKAGLWVSSSSTDLDVHISLRVIDADDRELRYEAIVLPMDPNFAHPVGAGSLKVSHRRLDAARSTDYLPVHTHTEADYAPLDPGEIVEIEVGLAPSTALIRKGYRLQLDIQPSSPAGIPSRAYDESYHDGATNTVYTGPDHVSYVQLPLLPVATR
jgi:putative CocE/NonD family hydrolase